MSLTETVGKTWVRYNLFSAQWQYSYTCVLVYFNIEKNYLYGSGNAGLGIVYFNYSSY
jgi:hypothetical protein